MRGAGSPEATRLSRTSSCTVARVTDVGGPHECPAVKGARILAYTFPCDENGPIVESLKSLMHRSHRVLVVTAILENDGGAEVLKLDMERLRTNLTTLKGKPRKTGIHLAEHEAAWLQQVAEDFIDLCSRKGNTPISPHGDQEPGIAAKVLGGEDPWCKVEGELKRLAKTTEDLVEQLDKLSPKATEMFKELINAIDYHERQQSTSNNLKHSSTEDEDNIFENNQVVMISRTPPNLEIMKNVWEESCCYKSDRTSRDPQILDLIVDRSKDERVVELVRFSRICINLAKIAKNLVNTGYSKRLSYKECFSSLAHQVLDKISSIQTLPREFQISHAIPIAKTIVNSLEEPGKETMFDQGQGARALRKWVKQRGRMPDIEPVDFEEL